MNKWIKKKGGRKISCMKKQSSAANTKICFKKDIGEGRISFDITNMTEVRRENDEEVICSFYGAGMFSWSKLYSRICDRYF